MPWNHQQSDTDFLGHTLDVYDRERDKRKAQEDDYLKWQQETIESLLKDPRANQDPSVAQGLLQDLHDTVHARYTPRPRKRDMEGFFGATELPHSRMLDQVMGGGRPMYGSPTQDVPRPPSAQEQGLIPSPTMLVPSQMGLAGIDPQGNQTTPPAQMGMQLIGSSSSPPAALKPPIEPGSIQRRHEAYAQSLNQAPPAPEPFLPVSQAEAPTGGASILSAPVQMPSANQEPTATAAGIVSAGRQMQQFNDGPKVIPVPPQKQPLLLSREAANQETANAAQMQAKGAQTGIYQSDLEAAQQFAGQPENVQTWLRGLRNIGRGVGAGTGANRTSLQNAIVNGQKMAVWVDPVTKHLYDQAGNILTGDIVLEGKAGAAGQHFTVQTKQLPNGEWQTLWIPKEPPEAGQGSGIVTADTGVKGRVPPPPPGGPVIQIDTPNGPQFARVGRSGTGVTPLGQAPGTGGQPGAPVSPKQSPMTSTEVSQLQSAKFVQSMLPDLENTLRKVGVNNNPIGQNFDLFLAQRGMSPGALEEQLIQLLGVVDARTLQAFAGGRPNMKIVDIVRIHVPQPGDTTKMAWDKVQTLKNVVLPKIIQSVQDADRIRQHLPLQGPGGGSDDAAFGQFLESLKKKPSR